MIRITSVGMIIILASAAAASAKDWISYDGQEGPGKGKHIVLVAGDEEYRSEEGLPMLAKILSERHGFKTTVLFSVNEEGVIDPTNQASLSGAELLDSADAIVILLRFRNWPDEQMKHFDAAFKRGVPVIGLRTSTHAFQYRNDRDTDFQSYNRFGKQVLGEDWVSHWGGHKREATLGIVEPGAENDPILRGVDEVFGDSDVYEAYPPADAKILLRGEVLSGMKPSDPPAKYVKKRRSDGKQQDVNGPPMPVAWTRLHQQDSGTKNKIFCTTLGAATDLQSEGLRRMILNSIFWGLDMEVPAKADVTYVDDFDPTMYGFGNYRRGILPADHAVGKVLPAGQEK
ncbi:MAG: ThuA domain-containing protein [Pirellulaceae bacterium]|nr:ThuA domain-containing protein [Pirellulaceae bacterium]